MLNKRETTVYVSMHRRLLKLSNVAMCEVPKTHTNPGDQSFTVAGLQLCNNLP